MNNSMSFNLHIKKKTNMPKTKKWLSWQKLTPHSSKEWKMCKKIWFFQTEAGDDNKKYKSSLHQIMASDWSCLIFAIFYVKCAQTLWIQKEFYFVCLVKTWNGIYTENCTVHKCNKWFVCWKTIKHTQNLNIFHAKQHCFNPRP